jgi:hypothetical protein
MYSEFCTQIEEIIIDMFHFQAKKYIHTITSIMPTMLLLTVAKRGERRDVSPSISRVHGSIHTGCPYSSSSE